MSNFTDIDNIFTSTCSSRTVQANENGFFKNFFLTVVDSFKTENEYKNWLKNQFGKLTSDYEKLQLLYTDDVVCWEILGTLEHVVPVYRKKDALFSWQKREQVMKLLKAYESGTCPFDLTKILILASQAVMRAPMKDVDREVDNGLTLCLALMTRSEVFYSLNDGSNGLNDIQLATKYGLPVKNNAEYYAKIAMLYALNNETKKSAISVNLYYQMTGMDVIRKEKLDNEINNISESVKSLNLTNNYAKKILPTMKQIKTYGEGTEIEKCTSTQLKLMESEANRAGKYFVASGEVKSGETLLVEKAKCACLYPKNFGTHCNHCFVRLIAPIGCTECASVAFCSIECRDIAISTYHKFECKFLDLLIGSGMSILCHIALKMVMQEGTPEKALAAGKRLSHILCKNADIRGEEDYFKRCLMSTFLLRCLQKSDFFGRRTTESAEPTPNELEIGALIFSYLQALQFNAHEIYETVSQADHKFSKAKVNYIGVGIYEVGAMFNHECYPSITRYFNSTNLIFNSIRPHVDGEMIAENYGPIFTKQTLPERQRNLQARYWFKCECLACKENWPVLDKLNNKCRLKCTTETCPGVFNYPQDRFKEIKCRSCKKCVSLQLSVCLLEEAQDLYQQGAVAMDEQFVDEAIKHFKSGIDLFHKVALPPHKDTHLAQESLRVCLADSGNTFTI